MMLPSSLLTSIFLLATSTYAADDGQWRPSQYSSAAAAIPTVQTKPLDTTAATPTLIVDATKKPTGVASQVVTATEATAAGGSWESQVTWPAGCESWANPCPPGAKISGGGVAGYTNGFTSYLTETDSNGVITGMPTKATIAAGVSEAAATTLVMSAKASGNESFTSRGPSSTQNRFTVETDNPLQSNSARASAFLTSSSLLVVAAAFALLC